MIKLLDKLFEVETASAANPEELLRKHWMKIVNTKLINNTFAGEQDYLKFWLLKNGDVIPIDYSHTSTAEQAGTSYNDLEDVGTVPGSIIDGMLSVRVKKDFTDSQISKLKNIHIDYNVTSISVGGTSRKFFRTFVKSPKETAYYLEYGQVESISSLSLLDKLFEAVATVSAEKLMRKYYKNKLNTKLTHSTWPTEQQYIKFWILTDGSLIPVKSSHIETIRAAGVLRCGDLEDEGTIAGSIHGGNLSIDGTKELTDRQISRLKNIFIEYDVNTLYHEVGRHNFVKPVGSSKELAYYLEYGDVDESKEVEEESNV